MKTSKRKSKATSHATNPKIAKSENIRRIFSEGVVFPSLEERVEAYLKVCRKCDECERFYPKPEDALQCLKSHGLTRCFSCFVLVATTDIFNHWIEQHSDINSEMNCPFCTKPCENSELEKHVLTNHSEESLLTAWLGGNLLSLISTPNNTQVENATENFESEKSDSKSTFRSTQLQDSEEIQEEKEEIAILTSRDKRKPREALLEAIVNIGEWTDEEHGRTWKGSKAVLKDKTDDQVDISRNAERGSFTGSKNERISMDPSKGDGSSTLDLIRVASTVASTEEVNELVPMSGVETEIVSRSYSPNKSKLPRKENYPQGNENMHQPSINSANLSEETEQQSPKPPGHNILNVDNRSFKISTEPGLDDFCYKYPDVVLKAGRKESTVPTSQPSHKHGNKPALINSIHFEQSVNNLVSSFEMDSTKSPLRGISQGHVMQSKSALEHFAFTSTAQHLSQNSSALNSKQPEIWCGNTTQAIDPHSRHRKFDSFIVPTLEEGNKMLNSWTLPNHHSNIKNADIDAAGKSQNEQTIGLNLHLRISCNKDNSTAAPNYSLPKKARRRDVRNDSLWDGGTVVNQPFHTFEKVRNHRQPETHKNLSVGENCRNIEMMRTPNPYYVNNPMNQQFQLTQQYYTNTNYATHQIRPPHQMESRFISQSPNNSAFASSDDSQPQSSFQKCPKCNKMFHTSNPDFTAVYNTHLDTHYGVFPFVCKLCPNIVYFEDDVIFRNHAWGFHNILLPVRRQNTGQIQILDVQ